MAADRYDERYRHETHRGERGLVDRAAEQVRSWFGHEDDPRRHHPGERHRERAYGGSHDTARSVRDESRDDRYSRDIRPHDRFSERGWTAEPERWRTNSRIEYDAAASRGWNEPDYGYRPAYGYGYGEWSTPGSRRSETRDAGESRGFYEDARGRVHEFEHSEAGRFAGRGPKGYRRSDERIREDVCDRLMVDPRIDASEIEVTVKDGEVILSGMVHSREEKRLSEHVVETISGVHDVQNTLRVSRWQDARSMGAGSSESRVEGSTPDARLEKR
jgi:hypothetical protein